MRLQVHVIPAHAAPTATPLSTFLEVASPTLTLEDLTISISDRYTRLYPHRPPLHIEKIQDASHNDLDLSYRVSDVFSDKASDNINSIVRVIQASTLRESSIPPESGLRPKIFSRGKRVRPALLEDVREASNESGSIDSLQQSRERSKKRQKRDDFVVMDSMDEREETDDGNAVRNWNGVAEESSGDDGQAGLEVDDDNESFKDALMGSPSRSHSSGQMSPSLGAQTPEPTLPPPIPLVPVSPEVHVTKITKLSSAAGLFTEIKEEEVLASSPFIQVAEISKGALPPKVNGFLQSSTILTPKQQQQARRGSHSSVTRPSTRKHNIYSVPVSSDEDAPPKRPIPSSASKRTRRKPSIISETASSEKEGEADDESSQHVLARKIERESEDAERDKIAKEAEARESESEKQAIREERESREREAKERESREARERAARAAEERERIRVEKERMEKERMEKERMEKERMEKERVEKERVEKERVEKEKQREKMERERLVKERERLAVEEAERKRVAQEKVAREEAARLKALEEAAALEKASQEKAAQEKTKEIAAQKTTEKAAKGKAIEERKEPEGMKVAEEKLAIHEKTGQGKTSQGKSASDESSQEKTTGEASDGKKKRTRSTAKQEKERETLERKRQLEQQKAEREAKKEQEAIEKKKRLEKQAAEREAKKKEREALEKIKREAKKKEAAEEKARKAQEKKEKAEAEKEKQLQRVRELAKKEAQPQSEAQEKEPQSSSNESETALPAIPSSALKRSNLKGSVVKKPTRVSFADEHVTTNAPPVAARPTKQTPILPPGYKPSDSSLAAPDWVSVKKTPPAKPGEIVPATTDGAIKTISETAAETKATAEAKGTTEAKGTVELEANSQPKTPGPVAGKVTPDTQVNGKTPVIQPSKSAPASKQEAKKSAKPESESESGSEPDSESGSGSDSETGSETESDDSAKKATLATPTPSAKRKTRSTSKAATEEDLEMPDAPHPTQTPKAQPPPPAVKITKPKATTAVARYEESSSSSEEEPPKSSIPPTSAQKPSNQNESSSDTDTETGSESGSGSESETESGSESGSGSESESESEDKKPTMAKTLFNNRTPSSQQHSLSQSSSINGGQRYKSLTDMELDPIPDVRDIHQTARAVSNPKNTPRLPQKAKKPTVAEEDDSEEEESGSDDSSDEEVEKPKPNDVLEGKRASAGPKKKSSGFGFKV